jgi:hypothetical protein
LAQRNYMATHLLERNILTDKIFETLVHVLATLVRRIGRTRTRGKGAVACGRARTTRSVRTHYE